MTCHLPIGGHKQGHDLPGILIGSAIANLGKPNCCLMIQNGCSTIAWMADKTQLEIFCSSVSSPPLGFLVSTRMAKQSLSMTLSAALAGGAFNGMNQAAFGINPNMYFHPEVPPVAFLGLAHLGITFLVLVLGRTRRSDQGGVDDRATLHAQPRLAQKRIDLSKDGNRQFVLFQQVTETKDRAFVGHDIFKSIESYELAQQGDIMQCFVHRWIRVAKPLLHEVNTQHLRQQHRRTAIAFLGVKRLNQGFKTRPRHDCFHLRQKTDFQVCLPALGKKPVSARLSCFMDFIDSVDTMTMTLFSQIAQYDGHLCRVSLNRITSALCQTTKYSEIHFLDC